MELAENVMLWCSISRAPSLYSIWASAVRSAPAAEPLKEVGLPEPPTTGFPGAGMQAVAIDPASTSYLLNPGSDLAATQETFQSWLEQQPSWQVRLDCLSERSCSVF